VTDKNFGITQRLVKLWNHSARDAGESASQWLGLTGLACVRACVARSLNRKGMARLPGLRAGRTSFFILRRRSGLAARRAFSYDDMMTQPRVFLFASFIVVRHTKPKIESKLENSNLM
jgi:hypothetical protein